MNRLIKADEVQIGHLYPLAGNETAPPETVKPEGQIANRVNFKRVWAWAQATGRVVTEAEWAANPGCFSSGDGYITYSPSVNSVSPFTFFSASESILSYFHLS